MAVSISSRTPATKSAAPTTITSTPTVFSSQTSRFGPVTAWNVPGLTIDHAPVTAKYTPWTIATIIDGCSRSVTIFVMRVARLHQPAAANERPLAIEEVAAPAPGPGEVLLDVAACGVCRTDLQIAEGDLEARRLPIVPGHQA